MGLGQGDQNQTEVGSASGDPRKQQWLEAQQDDGRLLMKKEFIFPEIKYRSSPVLPTDAYDQVPSWEKEDQEPGKHEAALRCCQQYAGYTRGAQPRLQGQTWEALKIHLCPAKKNQSCLKVCWIQSST